MKKSFSYFSGVKGGFGVLFSRATGLIRTHLMGHIVGVSHLSDAFFLSFRFPNLLREFLADGALSSALISTYYQNQEEKERAENLRTLKWFFQVGFFFFSIAFLFVLLFFCFAPALMSFYLNERESLVYGIKALRVMSVLILFAVVNSWMMSLMNLFDQNFSAFASSSLFNLIFAAYLLVQKGLQTQVPGVLTFLPWVVLGGSACQSGFLFWRLRETYAFSDLWVCAKETFQAPFSAVRSGWKVFVKILPRVSNQILSVFAWMKSLSFAQRQLPGGTLTHLSFAQIVVLVPVGVLGVAFSLSSLPRLSQVVQEDPDHFVFYLRQGLWFQIQFGFLILLACLLGSYAFVDLVFGWGEMRPNDLRQIAFFVNTMIFVSFFGILNKLLIQACFAVNRIWQTNLSAFLGFFVLWCVFSFGGESLLWYAIPLAALAGVLTEVLFTSFFLNQGKKFNSFLMMLGFLFVGCIFLQNQVLDWQIAFLKSKKESLFFLVILGFPFLFLAFLLFRRFVPKKSSEFS